MSDEHHGYTTERPDWVPEGADEKFTTTVMGGIEGIKDLTVGNINPKLMSGEARPRRRLVMTEDDYVAGVEKGDRMTLSRAITLIESNSSKHFKLAQRVLQRLLPRNGKALRAGCGQIDHDRGIRQYALRRGASCCRPHGRPDQLRD